MPTDSGSKSPSPDYGSKANPPPPAIVDDYPWSTDTPGRIVPNGVSKWGNIQFKGDRDLFAIDLIAGVSYDITLNRDSKSGVDPVLTLLGPSGSAIATEDGGKSTQSAHLYYTAPASGTYYLGAQDQAGAGTGGYHLNAQAIDDVPYNVINYVTLGAAPKGGRIELASDYDKFWVNLQAGSTYVFTLESDGTAAGLDPMLKLESASSGKGGPGSKIATDYDSGNPQTGWARIEFTPTISGTYYLTAMGEDGTSGGYLLSAGVLGTRPAGAATVVHEMAVPHGVLDTAHLQEISLVGVADFGAL